MKLLPQTGARCAGGQGRGGLETAQQPCESTTLSPSAAPCKSTMLTKPGYSRTARLGRPCLVTMPTTGHSLPKLQLDLPSQQAPSTSHPQIQGSAWQVLAVLEAPRRTVLRSIRGVHSLKVGADRPMATDSVRQLLLTSADHPMEWRLRQARVGRWHIVDLKPGNFLKQAG